LPFCQAKDFATRRGGKVGVFELRETSKNVKHPETPRQKRSSPEAFFQGDKNDPGSKHAVD
jgi:hypothetical protein